MGASLQDMLNERSVDHEAVDAHKRRMVEDVLVHRLRELREEAALTQVDLAERLNVSQNRVSSIERG
ncbi:helix-turn-helix transcriptional regulator [Nocardiopsis nanhaiensis]